MAGPWEQFQKPSSDAKPWEQFQTAPEPQSQSMLSSIGQGAGNLAAGALRGAGSIGATLISPLDAAARAFGVENSFIGRSDRRQAMDRGLQAMGAEPDSWMYQGGKLAGEVAGTAGAGGALANGVRGVSSAPAAQALANAMASGGFRTGATVGPGLGARAADLGVRTVGGAANGAVSAGMVDPGDAGLGAMIGGALPGASKLLGAAGRKIGSSLSGGGVGDEVKTLAQRAAELGIDVPVDRIANSKPLNAASASLNYVPFSGRAGTERKMQDQLNRALSRTFGQDSDNVTQALRKANDALGSEFDRVLSSNTVRVDSQFLNELAEHEATAMRELGQDGAGIISRQIDEIMSKGSSGEIDGQAAYNIKKMLDRIGRRNTPEAFYAGDLRKSLMGALNRSMTPDDAAAFATTRKQYGNMLSLEKLAQNGVEGDVSIARIANMKNIGNDDLQELADISAQFLKPREGQHGAMQRAVGAMGIGGFAGLPTLAVGALAGRGVNSMMNSQAARNMMLNGGPRGLPPEMMEILFRSAPVVGNQ